MEGEVRFVSKSDCDLGTEPIAMPGMFRHFRSRDYMCKWSWLSDEFKIILPPNIALKNNKEIGETFLSQNSKQDYKREKVSNFICLCAFAQREGLSRTGVVL